MDTKKVWSSPKDFHFDHKAKLSVPDGIELDAILVTVEIEPPTAACLIYGHLDQDSMGCVEVAGGRSDMELPFVRPEVFVLYLQGLKHLKIHTRGWKDRRQ